MIQINAKQNSLKKKPQKIHNFPINKLLKPYEMLAKGNI